MSRLQEDYNDLEREELLARAEAAMAELLAYKGYALALEEALRDLAQAESAFRLAHNFPTMVESLPITRAWDTMRDAGDRARSLLNSSAGSSFDKGSGGDDAA